MKTLAGENGLMDVVSQLERQVELATAQGRPDIKRPKIAMPCRF